MRAYVKLHAAEIKKHTSSTSPQHRRSIHVPSSGAATSRPSEKPLFAKPRATLVPPASCR